jgi:hypothetical protein
VTDPNPIISDGYFTWMAMLFDTETEALERLIGYAIGTLARGWLLMSPRFPIAPANLDLRGSSRWEDGQLPDGRTIGAVLSERTDLAAAECKLATFFDKCLDRRPAKVRPLAVTTARSFVPATPVGIPQFKLFAPIEWMILAEVPRGAVLRRQDVRA